MSRLLYRLSYPAMGLLPACWSVNRVRRGGIPPVRGGTGDEVRAPMRNRTADLLLTMETLCLLSYRGRAGSRPGRHRPTKIHTAPRPGRIGKWGPMEVPYAVAGPALLGQLRRLVGVAGHLDDRALLASSRCLGWTRADVLAHVHLALQDMLLALVAPTDAEPDTDAASYWRTDPPSNDPDSDELDNLRFARLLASAYRRPTGLIGHLRPTGEGVARAVSQLSTPAVNFQGHVLTSGDFLATWATELAVHHLDLDLGQELPGPDPAALRLARLTADELADQPSPSDWDDEHAVLVGWGRLPSSDWPAGGVSGWHTG